MSGGALIRPKALEAGAMLGIVSPAGSTTPELVAAGRAELERLGYRTKLFPHALDRGPLYYAGPLEGRLADLHAAFVDPEVDAVICTRGGWGSAELLPHLDRELIRANPKAFLGFSDQTSLHLWLRREAGLISFYAPMVSANFAHAGGVDLVSWSNALTQTEPWSLGTENGLRVLQPGTAEGVLCGGCLAIYAEAIGTPYAPRAEGGVLFLEDVGVKAYQWDRMLLHLRFAGLFEGVTGVVIGDIEQCGDERECAMIEAAILHALRWFKGPIGLGLKSGHVAAGNITLPLGVRVRLAFEDAGNPRVDFLEPAVTL